jgi:tetratricopeptide (TPR) repeat protein
MVHRCVVFLLVLFAPSWVRAEAADPPELAGPPKTFPAPTEAQRELLAAFPKDTKDPAQVGAGIAKLTALLNEHPDLSDGFFLRATFSHCLLEAHDDDSALKDIRAAIATHSAQPPPRLYDSTADEYALAAKIEFDSERYAEALSDLEAATKAKIEGAERIFGATGVKPVPVEANRCAWGLSQLDTLAKSFPHDYRPPLFRGLYLSFFTTFDQSQRDAARQEFQKAAILGPASPLPPYYIGMLDAHAAFWSHIAITSPQVREQLQLNVIASMTKAIRLNPAFREAYAERAGTHLNLKHYREAISDFDKVLSLNPEDGGAYHDRALAKVLSLV